MSDDATTGSRTATTAARLPAVAATAAATVAAGAAAVAVALPLLTGGDWLLALFETPEPVIAPSFALAGALMVPLPRARRLGWLLIAVALSAGLYVLAGSWARAYGDTGLAGWARTWVWLPALLLTTTVLPQVVPYGRALPGRWRAAAAAAVAFAAVATVLVAVTGTDPFGTPLFTVPLLLLLLVGAASTVVRVRRADGVERRQLAWVGYGVAVAVLATFLAPWWLVCVAVLAVPAGLLVAVTRYRLYEIDRVVNRTLVGAVLLALTALAYAALVSWTQALVGDLSAVAPVVATFLVALAFHPAYVRVQRLVDRLLHGRDRDPYALLSQVQRALGEGPSPRRALAAGVEETRRGLRLSGVAVRVPLADGSQTEVVTGDPGDTVEQVPLRLHGRTVATLVLPTRAAADVPGGRRLLEDLTGPLAAAAYAVRAAGDLERSRTALVEAREDERRRLRRDLHDGLGPQLSAVVMTVDTAGSALRRGDTHRVGALLGVAGEQAGEAVRDVRRLVHGLRPPALDDLGLLGALQAGAAALTGPDGPVVHVRGHGDLTSLPAATEVAVLRIAQEAVLNAVKHSGARTVAVEVRVDSGVDGGVDGGVAVDVVDDGRGFPQIPVPGVGLSSMRERAAELGGLVTVDSDAGGTRVRAVLPLVVDG
jgi:two-component system NarL family sensor kinase